MEALLRSAGVRVAALLIATVLAAGPSWAQQKLYKWVDEKGETHYGDKIPPEYAGKGNSELDKQGITRKVNEGQLTPEQQRERDEEKRKADEEQQRALEIQRRNKAVLTTYNNVTEIDVARDKELRTTEDAIQGIRQKIVDTQLLQAKLQKDLDSYKGKKAPNDLRDAMDQAQKDLRDSQQLAIVKRRETDNIRTKYAEIRRIYIDLRGDDSAEAGKTR